MKRKRKIKAARYSVDFVTALTADECRDYLLVKDLEGSSYTQQAYVGETGYFSVERTVTLIAISRREQLVSVQFRGHLDPVTNGTRVFGAITQETRQTISGYRRWLYLAAVSSLGLWLFTMLTQPIPAVLFMLVVLGLVVTLLFSSYHAIEHEANLLITWIKNQLHD
jgi:hypothetical protein